MIKHKTKISYNGNRIILEEKKFDPVTYNNESIF